MADDKTDHRLSTSLPADETAQAQTRKEINDMLASAELDLARISDPALRAEMAEQIAGARAQLRGGHIRPDALAALRAQVEKICVDAYKISSKDAAQTAFNQQHFMDLGAEAEMRITIRSQVITSANIHAFAATFVEQDAPPAVKELLTKQVVAAFQTEEGKALIKEVNAIPHEKREAIVRAGVGTEELAKKLMKDPKNAAVKEELAAVIENGSGNNLEVQKAVAAIANSDTPAEVVAGKKQLSQGNSEFNQRIVKYIPGLMKQLSVRDQHALQTIGDAEAIGSELREFRHSDSRKARAQEYLNAKLQGKPAMSTPELERDAALLQLSGPARAFSQQDQILATYYQLEKKPELYAGNGMNIRELDFENRAQTVYMEMTKTGRNKGLDIDSEQGKVLLTRIQATLIVADKKHPGAHAVQDMDIVARLAMSKEIEEEEHTITQKAQTAKDLVVKGVVAMWSGDKGVADQAAVSVGRGVKNNVQGHLGNFDVKIGAAHITDEAVSQWVGHEVTKKLQRGAEVAKTFHDLHKEADQAVANTFRPLDDMLDKKADIKATRDKFGQNLAGLANFIAKDPGLKKIFDADGDGKVEAHEIRDIMEKKYHVKDMDALKGADGKVMLDDIYRITNVPNVKQPAAPAKGK